MTQIMKLHQSTVEETMPKNFDGTEEETQDNRPRRYYVRVSDFVLARVIKALKETEEVSDITVSLSDGELLVAYDYKEN